MNVNNCRCAGRGYEFCDCPEAKHMPSFNNLPEAQAFALANNIIKYFRVTYTDDTTRKMRARGGHWPNMFPAFRIYMDIDRAIEQVRNRTLNSDHGRCEIETLYTDEVSNSPLAQ